MMARRNQLSLTKHRLEVGMSTLNPALHYSLFTKMQLPKGTTIPMKGPLFNSLREAHEWINQNERKSMLDECIIKVALEGKWEKYKVVTGPGRYLNAHTNVVDKPNCTIVLTPENGIGEHLVNIRLLKQVGRHKELLADYASDTYQVPPLPPAAFMPARGKCKRKAKPKRKPKA